MLLYTQQDGGFDPHGAALVEREVRAPQAGPQHAILDTIGAALRQDVLAARISTATGGGAQHPRGVALASEGF